MGWRIGCDFGMTVGVVTIHLKRSSRFCMRTWDVRFLHEAFVELSLVRQGVGERSWDVRFLHDFNDW